MPDQRWRLGVCCLRGMIMRSFCSGRRFSCLEVLLALLLSAPISLPAQSASSPQSGPQSQPGQPATSAPSSSQSQSQDTPALLQRPSHFETRHAAGSASLPRPAAGLAACRGFRAHAFAESLRKLDRKGQRGGVRVFTEASQLYLPGGHVAVYAARPRAGNVPGRGFG